MAHTDSHGIAQFDTITSALIAPVKAVWNFLVQVGEVSSKSQELEELSALSDKQLAARGLNREDLVRVVFRSYLHV